MEHKPKIEEDEYEDAGAGMLSTQDLWLVINAFFSDQGLVNQQLSSYNQFMETTMQAIMMEHGDMTLDQISQHSGGGYDQTVGHEGRLWAVGAADPEGSHRCSAGETAGATQRQRRRRRPGCGMPRRAGFLWYRVHALTPRTHTPATTPSSTWPSRKRC